MNRSRRLEPAVKKSGYLYVQRSAEHRPTGFWARRFGHRGGCEGCESLSIGRMTSPSFLHDG
jgi:hypothetical protein